MHCREAWRTQSVSGSSSHVPLRYHDVRYFWWSFGKVGGTQEGSLATKMRFRNWALVGTYHHPRIERDQAFCLLGEHDAARISYIFSHMDQYDFRKCLFELKIGVAVNSVQFVISAIERENHLFGTIRYAVYIHFQFS
jgi:hypothetical protein